MKSDVIQFMQNILQASHIPMHRIADFTAKGLELFDLGLRSKILGLPDPTSQIWEWLSSSRPDVIYFHKDIFQCYYISLYLPEEKEWFFCGPLLFNAMDEAHFQSLMENLKLPEEFHANLKFYYERLPFFPSRDILKSIFEELGNIIYGSGRFEIEYNDNNTLDLWHTNYKNYLRIPEEPFLNIRIIEARYETENALMDAVSNCNEPLALELAAKFRTFVLPQRLPDRVRDLKDYTITFNTLLRKSAEQAGVHPIHIDSHSNSTIPLIEDITNAEELNNFQVRMVHDYCNLIRKYNLQHYSVIIRKALTYINTDLCADLRLNVLAEMLNVNASYLSTLFKKEVGMTLTDYVNKSRVEHAQKLLLCTDLPIKSIAQQCGIPDIYYFTRLFKRITGTTPKVYRDESPHETRTALFRLKQGAKEPKSPPYTQTDGASNLQQGKLQG